MSDDDTPTCDACGSSLADEDVTDSPDAYVPSFGSILRGIAGPALAGMVIACAFFLGADSISCGYNDARRPYAIGNSYAAIAIQHTPTYWAAYQLTKPRHTSANANGCVSLGEDEVQCSMELPSLPPGGCIDLTTGMPCGNRERGRRDPHRIRSDQESGA